MIGFDDWFNEFDQHFANTNYPPYNTIKVSNNEYRVEVALAGFKKDNIKVYTEEGRLVIEGKKPDGVEQDYVHKGLAQRAFKRTWSLPNELEVKSVRFEDGLLLIDIKKLIPEAHQRKDWL
jgi:molecular chaperone IbpA|tara:strand:- start:3391 stop:3753 length:363 start_codon:yes stop_codon:yes gene_type:complete